MDLLSLRGTNENVLSFKTMLFQGPAEYFRFIEAILFEFLRLNYCVEIVRLECQCFWIVHSFRYLEFSKGTVGFCLDPNRWSILKLVNS